MKGDQGGYRPKPRITPRHGPPSACLHRFIGTWPALATLQGHPQALRRRRLVAANTTSAVGWMLAQLALLSGGSLLAPWGHRERG